MTHADYLHPNKRTTKPEPDRADAAIRKMADAVLADVVRADADRGQVIRDAVAKAGACEAAP